MTSGSWRDWLRLRRLVPVLIVLIAVAVVVLDMLGYAKHIDAERVVIGMLALLAIDALIERVAIIERIDHRLARLETPELLRDRGQMIPIQSMATGASEIAACGVTLVSLITPHFDYLAARLDEGVSIRFLIVDPKSNAWTVWNEAQRIAAPEDIDLTIRTLKALAATTRRGALEVRLSPFFLPTSLVIVDGKKPNGQMNVELAFTALQLPSRPHLHLSRRASPRWFQFFCDRFEYLWGLSTPLPLAPDPAVATAKAVTGATVPR